MRACRPVVPEEEPDEGKKNSPVGEKKKNGFGGQTRTKTDEKEDGQGGGLGGN